MPGKEKRRNKKEESTIGSDGNTFEGVPLSTVVTEFGEIFYGFIKDYPISQHVEAYIKNKIPGVDDASRIAKIYDNKINELGDEAANRAKEIIIAKIFGPIKTIEKAVNNYFNRLEKASEEAVAEAFGEIQGSLENLLKRVQNYSPQLPTFGAVPPYTLEKNDDQSVQKFLNDIRNWIGDKPSSGVYYAAKIRTAIIYAVAQMLKVGLERENIKNYVGQFIQKNNYGNALKPLQVEEAKKIYVESIAKHIYKDLKKKTLDEILQICKDLGVV